MTKLTAKQIDERCERVLDSLYRAQARGEINQAQLDIAMSDLARWSVEQYQQLPQAKAVDAIFGLLLGEKPK